MKSCVINVVDFFKKYPATVLVAFFYFVILPSCINYGTAWQNDEQLNLRSSILHATGRTFVPEDVKLGFNLPLFEYAPRPTRPLSAYFEIVDTKFRNWLWNFFVPHPSFSLTWLFSLILAPLFLFLLLRNLDVNVNTALAAISLYLANPGVLSCVSMSGRPGKPMTNFAIILCLYLTSFLYKRDFVEKKTNKVPSLEWYVLMGVIFLSFFWDETAIILYPAVILLFPRVFKWDKKIIVFAIALLGFMFSYHLVAPHFHGLKHNAWDKATFIIFSMGVLLFPYFLKWDRKFLVYALMPVGVSLCYNIIFPWFAHCLGYPYWPLANYSMVSAIFSKMNIENLKWIFIDAKTLIGETVGMVGLSPHVLLSDRLVFYMAAIALGIMGFYILRSPRKHFLTFLLLLLAAGMHVFIWFQLGGDPGAYYYGVFYCVFFTIYIARVLNDSSISKYVLTACVFIVLVNMQQCFLFTNSIHKKWFYYREEFSKNNEFLLHGEDFNFHDRNIWLNPDFRPVFSGAELHNITYKYWSNVKHGESTRQIRLPKELMWLRSELEPEKYSWPNQQGLGPTPNRFGFYEPPISFYESLIVPPAPIEVINASQKAGITEDAYQRWLKVYEGH